MITLKLDPEGDSLSERVYLSLRKALLTGELYPGFRLVVLDIANSLGISQAPVREAMERLKQEGLLISKHHKGSFVSDITQQKIDHIYEMRELIEGYAIKKTIPTLKSSDLDHLNQLYLEMKRCAQEDDVFQLMEYDMRFHGFFYERCGNEVITQLWNQINIQIKRFIAVATQIYFPNLEAIADSHIPLLRSLENGDVNEAEQIFSKHIKVWWRMKK
ncbi:MULTISPECIES: GntR family transcriptional regulator [unclassified Paenibacillus]|uniref:GntR family transcriptional regulator n=1 Tax=unclassified Paenibacillus TaxID=185978 RepID=UPI001AE47B4D|nr:MULTISPECIES: GntR family transcriptional regulator [unclassified Paenibacillus]MBP1153605.1 DNA-binding GntR family transcriptional regulator [Paenibacillus sp. PvP091]MBP1171010.1 DNA-binding GntR family transcriptional regulator [Paenibacillus sp. PvR098]MBP2442038.1 DNA-binding GntR family transcriptional regulator [Paenibacillus sp. PvP052]